MGGLANRGISVVVPTGAIGAGIKAAHVAAGIAAGARAIASDAGSTDSGPSYLARGVSKWNREAVKRDLEVLMVAGAQAGIPVLIGSCGTSGSNAALDWTRDIAVEIAQEQNLTPKIAVLYSEQDRATIKRKLAEGAIAALPPSGPMDDALIDQCDHIVALLGPEPYIAALQAGATIVLGGRTTDTAVLAAVPLMHGAGAGPAWHAGKTAECGGVCTVQRGQGGVLITVFDTAFEIEPLAASNQCTVQTVSAHMLYENSDPYRLIEPGGVLDVTDAVYIQLNDRRVRVTGSRWEAKPYTMKLEGAGGGPFQTTSLVGIEDPKVLAELDLFHDRLHAGMCERIDQTFGADAGDYDVSLRIYGWNAVSGRKMPADAAVPHEVGVLMVITAATQDLATRMSKTCNPTLFHYPLSPEMPQPSYGFAFTPAETEQGQVFRFYLNHVVATAGGRELVRTEWVDLTAKQEKKESIDA
jgi:Acyclic terpene utilisation family protein AtuA